MSTSIPPPPPKRVPPPCWAHDESVALIHAYRHKWNTLGRRNLRALDWDAVASAVASAVPSSSSPKSAVQCRHKIEKLRKRYRTEKQRCLAYPGRFVSSWNLFPLLDSLEIGPSSAAGSNQHQTLGNRNSNPNLDMDNGFCAKTLKFGNSVSPGYRVNNCVKIDGSSNANIDFDCELGGGYGVKGDNDGNSVTLAIRAQNYAKIEGRFNTDFEFDSKTDGNSSPSVDFGYNVGEGGFPVKTLGDRIGVPPVFKSNNYLNSDGKFNPKHKYDHDIDHANDRGDWLRSKTPEYSTPVGPRLKNSTPDIDSRVLNGFSSSSRPGFGKKNCDGGVKREIDPVAEMVSAIELLGEGYVKMEKTKMEMAREIEKMRMEMEMKRSEMILESQQQIVDVFLKALFEKKKKKKVEVAPPGS